MPRGCLGSPPKPARRSQGVQAADTVTKQMMVVSKSADLTALVSRLVDGSAWRTKTALPAEAVERVRLADTVVVDVPLSDRAATVARLRRCFFGPLIVIAERGEGSSGLPDNDAGIVLLARPFAVSDLSAALGILAAPARTSTTPVFSLLPAAGSGPAGATVSPPTRTRTAARQPSPPRRSRFMRAARLVPSLPGRRGPRVALLAAGALITFVGAFALTARGGCEADCKDLANASPVQDTTPPLGASGMAGSSGRPATDETSNPRSSVPPGTGEIGDGSGSAPNATLTRVGRSSTTTATQRSTFGSTAQPVNTTAASPTTTAPTTTAPTTTAPPTTTPTDG
jgi:hypothetical protein